MARASTVLLTACCFMASTTPAIAFVIERTITRDKSLKASEAQGEYLGEFVYDSNRDNDRVGKIEVEAWGELGLAEDALVAVPQGLRGRKTASSHDISSDDVLKGEAKQTVATTSSDGSYDEFRSSAWEVDTPSVQILVFDDERRHWQAFEQHMEDWGSSGPRRRLELEEAGAGGGGKIRAGWTGHAEHGRANTSSFSEAGGAGTPSGGASLEVAPAQPLLLGRGSSSSPSEQMGAESMLSSYRKQTEKTAESTTRNFADAVDMKMLPLPRQLWSREPGLMHIPLARCSQMKADAVHMLTIRLDGTTDNHGRVEIGVREKIRPRVWYFIAMFCGVTFKSPVSLKLHLTNTNLGSQAELSMTQVHLPDLYIVALVFQILLLLYTISRINWRGELRARGAGNCFSVLMKAVWGFCRGGKRFAGLEFVVLPLTATLCNILSTELYILFYRSLCADGVGVIGLEIGGFLAWQIAVFLLWASLWHLACGNVADSGSSSAVLGGPSETPDGSSLNAGHQPGDFSRRNSWILHKILALLGVANIVCDLFLDIDSKLGNFMYTSYSGLFLWLCYFLVFLALLHAISETHGGQSWNLQQSKWFFSFLMMTGSWYVLQYLVPLLLSCFSARYVTMRIIVVVDQLARCLGFLLVFRLYETYDSKFLGSRYYGGAR